MKVIDAKNAVLGRLASMTAKQLLNGEEIAVVNAEKAIVTGNPTSIREKYLRLRRIGNPHHGPFYPTKPDAIVRRTIRSMMPYKTNKGRIAFKRLRVYVGVPEQLAKEGKENIANKLIRSNFITVKEVSKTLGWKESINN